MFKALLTLCAGFATAMDGDPYENFSFDYTMHSFPLAYATYGNAVELTQFLKLNS